MTETAPNNPPPDVAMVEAWTPHNGGRCPVSVDADVEVITRSGSTIRIRAGAVVWAYGSMVCEIMEPLPAAAEVVFYRLSATPPPARVGQDDQCRTIEILRRALAWHGDPQRLATTREEWQQEVDAAIVWVKANPEPDRPSFSSFATRAPSGTHAEGRADGIEEAS